MSSPLWEECAWYIPKKATVDVDSSSSGRSSSRSNNISSSNSSNNNNKEVNPSHKINNYNNNNKVNVKDEVNTQGGEEYDELKEVDINQKSCYKFNIDHEINSKIYLYHGDIYKIPCDAIVLGQNESLSDRLDANYMVFELAGIHLESELSYLSPIITGDSCITNGGLLPCNYIIHAVGPRYDPKYMIASDHALFSAYKSSLVHASNKNLKTIIFSCIYKHHKKYPRFDAAHVALRTVRRYLEHEVGRLFEKVMFCFDNYDDFEIYSTLLYAYFPRDKNELNEQLNFLPLEIGDEWGEIVIPDRLVRLSMGPQPLPKDTFDQYRDNGDNTTTTTTTTTSSSSIDQQQQEMMINEQRRRTGD